jgi:hypothetical protein
MALTNAEMYELLCITDEELRRIRAQAESLLDWTARQRAVLTRTFPEWTIISEADTFGRPWWTAHLLYEVSLEMATAGIDRTVRRTSAVSLAAALTLQAALIRSWRGLQRATADGTFHNGIEWS